MRAIRTREREDEVHPGSPDGVGGPPRVAGMRRTAYLSPGQLAARLGVTHGAMDDALDKLGIRRKRKDNKEALSVRLTPGQVADIRRRLGR